MQCGPWWTSFYSGMKLQFHPYELILSLGFFFFFHPSSSVSTLHDGEDNFRQHQHTFPPP